ncbi:transposase [Aeromonas sp. R2-2]
MHLYDPRHRTHHCQCVVATIGNANNFENSRQLVAWSGLVRRQHSSGGK